MQEQIALLPLSLADLRTLISDSVSTGIAAANAAKEPSEPEGYLSRVQAAKFLHISLQTLNEKTKSGELSGHRLGARILYKRVELEAALVSTSRYKTAGKKRGPKPKVALAATTAK